jgi:hypothetical protein
MKFMRDMFFHYNLCVGQLHPNRLVLVKAFQEYFATIGVSQT